MNEQDSRTRDEYRQRMRENILAIGWLWALLHADYTDELVFVDATDMVVDPPPTHCPVSRTLAGQTREEETE